MNANFLAQSITRLSRDALVCQSKHSKQPYYFHTAFSLLIWKMLSKWIMLCVTWMKKQSTVLWCSVKTLQMALGFLCLGLMHTCLHQQLLGLSTHCWKSQFAVHCLSINAGRTRTLEIPPLIMFVTRAFGKLKPLWMMLFCGESVRSSRVSYTGTRSKSSLVELHNLQQMG